jgi:hypothetical protein
MPAFRQLSLGCSCHDLWNPFRYCRHGSPNFRQQQADYSCSSKYRAQCMQLPTIKYTSRLVPFYWITWYCMSQWHGTRMNHWNLFDLWKNRNTSVILVVPALMLTSATYSYALLIFMQGKVLFAFVLDRIYGIASELKYHLQHKRWPLMDNGVSHDNGGLLGR